jgi:hypothetical protein
MALEFKSTIGGVGRKLSKPLLCADSQTLSVGDSVKTDTTSGELIYGAAALPTLGIITAFTDKDGMPIKLANPVAGTASGVDVRTVATGTAGTTYAIVDMSNQTVYSAECNGTIGTTVNSEVIGARADIDSANTDYGRILETTCTRTLGTPATFFCHGADPNDSTRMLVTIAISELDSVYE